MEFGQVDHKEMEIVVLSVLKAVHLEDVVNWCTYYITSTASGKSDCKTLETDAGHLDKQV